MEITTTPHRPASTPWGRLVALVVVLAPVSVLVLLPLGLGFERYVMSGDSMDSGQAGGITAGSVLLERAVPVDELVVGDVITYEPPSAAGVDGLVTHRIVRLGTDGIRTQGDASDAPDPWILRPEGPTLPRVELTLRWVGYAYLLLVDPYTRLLMTVGAVVLVVVVVGEVRRRRQPGPALTETAGRRRVLVPPHGRAEEGGGQE
jgi:signal peptidase